MTNSKEPVIVDFSQMGGPVYSGRAKGELARKTLGLNAVDAEQSKVVVYIPADTYSVTTSFFLGLFGESIRQAGSREKFLSLFNFEAPDVFKSTFDSCISRALIEHSALVPRK